MGRMRSGGHGGGYGYKSRLGQKRLTAERAEIAEKKH